MDFRLPAGGGNCRFKAQPADDLLNIGVDTMGRRHQRGHDNTPGPLQVVAVETAQSEPAAGETLQQERADVRLFRVAARHRYDQAPTVAS